MSGKRSRDKGKRGEREWASFLRTRGWTTARRGVQHQGGPDAPDVVCPELEGFHFEVKRTERLSLYDAMAQARTDAGGKVPIVAHRRNKCEWLVVLRAEDFSELLRGIGDG